MAIAIRGTTPATATDNGGSATVAATVNGARQPQAGDVLIIIHCNDFYDITNMPTPTVDGSTTGVTAITNGTADAGANAAHAKSYYWVNSSTGDRAVSVTETGSHDEEKALDVYVLSGVDTGTPIDVAGNTANAVSGPSWVLSAISPTSSDAFLIGHVNTSGGNSGGGSVTPPGSMTEAYDVNVGGITHEGATQQLAASGSTGTRTFTPASDAGFAGLLIAVMTASAASAPSVAAATPPLPPHLLYALAARNQAMWQQSQASADITPTPAEAVGSGTADPASIALTVAATEAAGSGTAVDGQAGATTTASEATGSGTAFDATASFAGTVNPAEAAGTGAAFAATTAATVTAAEATGSGTAYFDAGSAISLELTADDAVYGAGVAYDATASTSSAGTVNPTEAAGSGAAHAATTAAAVNAAEATGSGTAFNPSTSGSLNVAAVEATGSGTADNAGASAAVPAGVATGSGTADNAAAGNGPVPAEASGSGTAPAAVPAATVDAASAAGTGTAFDATAVAGGPGNVAAGVASGSGFAYDALTRKLIIRPFSGVTSRPVGSPAMTPRP